MSPPSPLPNSLPKHGGPEPASRHEYPCEPPTNIFPSSFVSRANPKTNDKHVVLGVIGWKPRDFAAQMNLSVNNGWGIVRTIADMCLQRGDGKFVLVKDPNKSILRLYELPAGSLEDDEEDMGPITAADGEE